MFSLLAIFVFLLACSAFFSGAETAIFSLSDVEVHTLRKSRSKSKSISKLYNCLKKPRDVLVTILFGNELVNMSISIVGAAIVSRTLVVGVESETLIAVAAITPLILVFGEIVPKNISLKHARQFAPAVIWPLQIMAALIRPLRVFLVWIADGMVSLFGGDNVSEKPMMMEEEFLRLVDMGRQEGTIDSEERDIIHNVFEFTDKVVADIMTPAGEALVLSVDLDYDTMMKELGRIEFSRVPFYKVDRANIIGILHVRDLFEFDRKRKGGETMRIETILREPLFVDGGMPLEALLKEFQKAQLHMAIVKGAAGEFAGLVTLDDVLEELFGEIED